MIIEWDGEVCVRKEVSKVKEQVVNPFDLPGEPVCFITSRLFTKGKYKDNIKFIANLARELYFMGFISIQPQTLCPWLIDGDKEVNRVAAMKVCRTVILKVDFVVFDFEMRSEGVKEEICFAVENHIPVFEIHYIRKLLKMQ